MNFGNVVWHHPADDAPLDCESMEYADRLALYSVCGAATCMYCVRKAAGLLDQPVQSVTGRPECLEPRSPITRA